MQILAAPFPSLAGDYQSIATVSVGSGGTGTITFSSIPSTYKHLQVRAISRVTNAVTFTDVFFRFNSDSSANYSYHALYGSGASTFSTGGASTSEMYPMTVTGSSLASNIFAVGVVDILDYADTNKYKTTRGLTGFDSNGGGYVFLTSGNWRSSSAINTITITSGANTFAQHTQFALYGIKG